MTVTDVEASEFEVHRDHLMGVAYRMLGNRADAEDAVQEAWLRWSSADQSAIVDARGWLTTVTARLCLDVLRSARLRREAYTGPWLPEPVVQRLPAAGDHADPADTVAERSEVSLALLAVLERLTPEQRVAFVLHDVFAVPFDGVAAVLDTTTAAARQLASRARRAVRDGEPRHTADAAEQRRTLEAFVAAAAGGDLEGLLRVLAPDAVLVTDGGGVVRAARHEITGSDKIARFLAGLVARYGTTGEIEPVVVNGQLGLLIAAPDVGDGVAELSVLAVTVADGQITAMYIIGNPAKLTRVPRPR